MKILTVFGFIPITNDPNRLYRSIGRISQQFFLVMLIVPSIMAVYRSLNEKNMDLTLKAFYYLAIQFYITSSFYTSMTRTNGLRNLFRLLEDNITERSDTFSGKYYTKADRLYTIFYNAYLILSILTLATMIIPSVISTMRYYFTYDEMALEQWIVPFYFSIPFEMDNLWKYSLVITLSALSISGVALGKIIIHELYYRGGFQIIACTMDLSHEISQITSIIHEDCNDKNKKLKEHFKKILFFHQKIIEFFNLYSSMVSGVVFFEFASLYFLLGSTGFLVAQNLLGGSSDIIQFKTVLLAAFSSLMMTSKLGTEISLYLYKMSHDMYSIEWEELPLEFEKYIVIILPLLQKPLYLTGYGILKCDWLTFSSVVKAIVSFILLLRQFV
ncbi:odorant receptor 9a-like [Contarinia nasturtii]|uniref:odorant receptor 9a-like n=1 Tax=Contarinia nasturtii TaxID=265458 RepID=UPI0012D399C4|nr:odorant receptor 9a-like [Contarinia nasturtii]